MGLLLFGHGGMSCRCPAGQVSAAGDVACKPCGAGLYTGLAADSVSNACLQCPAGHYSSTTSASSGDVCQPCPVGTFSSALGVISKTLCNACPAGQLPAFSCQSACCDLRTGRETYCLSACLTVYLSICLADW
jgi:hypothetical protein